MAGRSNWKRSGNCEQRCTNTPQPTLNVLVEIACILEVDVRELLVPKDTQKIIVTVL